MLRTNVCRTDIMTDGQKDRVQTYCPTGSRWGANNDLDFRPEMLDIFEYKLTNESVTSTLERYFCEVLHISIQNVEPC